MRVFAAFLVAPSASVLPLFLFNLALRIIGDTQPVRLDDIGEMALLIGGFGLPVAYAIAIFIGVPAYYALMKAGIIRRLVTISVAASIGGLFVILLELRRVLMIVDGSSFSYSSGGCASIVDNVRTSCGYLNLLRDTGLYAASGALSGLVFWAIYTGWRPGRPNPARP